MANFKITNITNILGKRHPNYNTPLNIEYVNGFKKFNYSLRPNEEFFLTVSQLPISVHKLRMKNFVTVVEIGEKELADNKKAKERKLTPVIKQSPIVEGVKEMVAKPIEIVEKSKGKKSTHTTTQSPE
jgi:hypothetical protein